MITMELQFTIETTSKPEPGWLEPRAFIGALNAVSFPPSGFLRFLCSLKGLEDKRHRGPLKDQLFHPFFM